MSGKRNYGLSSKVSQAFAAAEKNDGSMQAIIESENMTLTVKNKAGRTLAHIAAQFGNLEGMRYLLKKEPSLIDVSDSFHTSVLHLATIQGSLEMVKYLVEEHGADICHMSGRYADRTAVHAAVEFNRLDILKYFVEERKIDFNRPHSRQTIPPLFLAVRNRNWEVIEYLVEERNANVRMLKSNEENILFVIVREDFLNLMKYFLDELRIDFNVDWKNHHGETPVHVAAILGRMQMLEYLVVEKHANVNAQKMSDLRTPLHYAAAHDHFDVCEFLVKHGADARLEDSYGDLAADKTRDDRLFEFLKHAANSRNPRSVASDYSIMDLVPPPPPPQPLKSIGYLPAPVPYVNEAESFFPNAVNLSFFHSFLLLAKSITSSIVCDKQTHEMNETSFLSPSSMIRSKMSAAAMDAVRAGPIFERFEIATTKSV